MRPARVDGVAMVDDEGCDAHGEPVYDIRLGRTRPDALREHWPVDRTCTWGAQTAFLGEVRDPAQLDTLLEKLLSVGLVLDDVHRVAGPAEVEDGVATYEVRVAGEVGASLLSYLSWRHYLVPEQTLVRIAAGTSDLLRCLRACTEAGASIEAVHRVLPAP